MNHIAVNLSICVRSTHRIKRHRTKSQRFSVRTQLFPPDDTYRKQHFESWLFWNVYHIIIVQSMFMAFDKYALLIFSAIFRNRAYAPLSMFRFFFVHSSFTVCNVVCILVPFDVLPPFIFRLNLAGIIAAVCAVLQCFILPSTFFFILPTF